MADAFGADVDGGPDGLGAGGLAGVGGEVEAGVAGFGVGLAEVFGGAAGLVAADADADDGGVVAAEFGGLAEDACALFGAEVADGVDEPEDGGAEVLLGADAAGLDGGEDLVDVKAAEAVEDAEGDVDLGVADALARRGRGPCCR